MLGTGPKEPSPWSRSTPLESGPVSTGLAELDRVLGGGLVPGSVTLLGGEPGVGKSTLLLQVLSAMAGAGAPVLLVSAEESAQQIRRRAERLGPLPAGLMVLSTTDLSALPGALRDTAPVLVVVDSIQAVADPGRGGRSREPRSGAGLHRDRGSTSPRSRACPSCSLAT